uniref:RING-type domain-containing protein n=1 Tax=Meloidogyne javanica TaxID=6303 RepID=A0A915LI23_MELJA
MFSPLFIFLLMQTLCHFGKTQNEEVFDKCFKYLLVDKNVQTHIYPYNNGHHIGFNRGIYETAMNGLIIYLNEIEEILGEEQASQFYNHNHRIFQQDNNGDYCNVIDIVRAVFGTGNLMIPPKYGKNYVIGHQVLKEEPETFEEYIDHLNQIDYQNKNFVYRWELNLTGDEERNFLLNGFANNQNGSDKLEDCLNMEIFENQCIASTCYHHNPNGLFNEFYKLYKRFHPKQLYFNDIPIWLYQKYGHRYRDTKLCSICREDFKRNNDIHVNTCKHVHHVNCLEGW